MNSTLKSHTPSAQDSNPDDPGAFTRVASPALAWVGGEGLGCHPTPWGPVNSSRNKRVAGDPGCEARAGALTPGPVPQVDYEGTARELEAYFNHCGEIHRVTILCDKFSGHPKGSVGPRGKGLGRG